MAPLLQIAAGGVQFRSMSRLWTADRLQMFAADLRPAPGAMVLLLQIAAG